MRDTGKLSGSEWTLDDLIAIEHMCSRHAANYALDTFPNQMEVITSEQMLDSYISAGLPVNYAHWSFGKHFLIENAKYRSGQNSLAYEIVINTNPCIAFLMEDNSLAMQALVIPHACFGHNSFSKGNYLFRQWTQPDAILDYMLFARNYIAECEDRHGFDKVEQTLDALHALRDQGLDKYKRPSKLDSRKERAEQAKRLFAAQETMRQAEYYSVVPHAPEAAAAAAAFPLNPEENLLYFLEKHAPKLEPWQRELARIVRKIAQYFYPQRQTQVMNEGWGTDWLETFHDTMHNYRDESFLLQFLTPKLVRDFKLMNILTREGLDHWTVTETAGPASFKEIRSRLAAAYRLESSIPEISAVRYARDTDRKLVLHHQSYDGKVLMKPQAEQTLTQLRKLWGFDVSLESIDQEGHTVKAY